MTGFLKYILYAVLVVLLGFIPAYAYHQYKLSTTNERFFWEQWTQTTEGKTEGRLFFSGGNTIDLGQVNPEGPTTKEVLMRNTGEQILFVWSGDNEASGVELDLGTEKVEIAPRGSFPITISIPTPPTEDFSQTIIFNTEDQQGTVGVTEVKVIASVSKN